MLVAQDAGFGSWTALLDAVSQGLGPGAPYSIDEKENAEWETLFAVMKERGITALRAYGLMTDEVLARAGTLEHVISLGLGGSRELTEDGLLQLARMPWLEWLDLSEYPGGKPRLHSFDTGRLTTDEGPRLLRGFPAFARREGGEARFEPQGPMRGHLLIDGPVTDEGLAALDGLEGVFELDLFWHVTELGPDAFARLAGLPNLMSLGADGDLSGERAMAPPCARSPRSDFRTRASAISDAVRGPSGSPACTAATRVMRPRSTCRTCGCGATTRV